MRINVIAGLVVGLLATGLLYVLHALDVLRTPFGSQLLMLSLAFHITGLIAALGIHRYLAKEEGGAPFSRLFGAGLMVSLVAGVVLSLGTQFFVTSIAPDYLEWVKTSSLERLEQVPELSDEDRAMHLQQLEKLDARSYAVQTLTSTLLAGFFLSLTLAALLRMRVVRAAKT